MATDFEIIRQGVESGEFDPNIANVNEEAVKFVNAKLGKEVLAPDYYGNKDVSVMWADKEPEPEGFDFQNPTSGMMKGLYENLGAGVDPNDKFQYKLRTEILKKELKRYDKANGTYLSIAAKLYEEENNKPDSFSFLAPQQAIDPAKELHKLGESKGQSFIGRSVDAIFGGYEEETEPVEGVLGGSFVNTAKQSIVDIAEGRGMNQDVIDRLDSLGYDNITDNFQKLQGIKTNKEFHAVTDELLVQLNKAQKIGDDVSTTGYTAALGHSVDQMEVMIGSGIRTIADIIDSDVMDTWGKDYIQQNNREIAKAGYVSKYKKDFADTIDEDGGIAAIGWISEKMAENAAMGAFSLVGGAAGVIAAPLSAGLATLIGTGTLAGTTLMGIGEVRQEMEEKGVYDADKNAGLAAAAGIFIGFLDKITGKSIPKGALLKRFVDSGAAAQLGTALVKEGATEIIQEGVAIGAAAYEGAEYEPSELLSRAVDAGVLGAAFGFTVGGAGQIASNVAKVDERKLDRDDRMAAAEKGEISHEDALATESDLTKFTDQQRRKEAYQNIANRKPVYSPTELNNIASLKKTLKHKSNVEDVINSFVPSNEPSVVKLKKTLVNMLTHSEGQESLFDRTEKAVKILKDVQSGKTPITEVTAVDAIEPTDASIIEGRSDETYTSDNQSIGFTYAVVEASSLITSHDISGNVNPAFPEEYQPRQRDRKASLKQIANITNNPTPKRLEMSPEVNNGAPVIGGDLIVEAGNGRVIGLTGAYQRGNADAYKTYMRDNAESFGLDAETVEGMSQPILVRKRTTAVDREEFAKTGNRSTQLGSSPVENAISDSKTIRDKDLDLYRLDKEGNIHAASNKDFIAKFFERIGENESASLQKDDLSANPLGVTRIRNAVFYKAYQSDSLIELTSEEVVTDVANILNALNRAAPFFVRARAKDSEKTTAVIQPIVDAITIIRSAKRAGQNPEEALRQIDMVSGKVSDEIISIADFIIENTRSGKAMGEVFSNAAMIVLEQIEAKETVDLFGSPEFTPLEIINEAKKRYEETKKDTGQSTLLDQSEDSSEGVQPREPEQEDQGTKKGIEELTKLLQATIDVEKDAVQYSENHIGATGATNKQVLDALADEGSPFHVEVLLESIPVEGSTSSKTSIEIKNLANSGSLKALIKRMKKIRSRGDTSEGGSKSDILKETISQLEGILETKADPDYRKALREPIDTKANPTDDLTSKTDSIQPANVVETEQGDITNTVSPEFNAVIAEQGVVAGQLAQTTDIASQIDTIKNYAVNAEKDRIFGSIDKLKALIDVQLSKGQWEILFNTLNSARTATELRAAIPQAVSDMKLDEGTGNNVYLSLNKGMATLNEIYANNDPNFLLNQVLGRDHPAYQGVVDWAKNNDEAGDTIREAVKGKEPKYDAVTRIFTEEVKAKRVPEARFSLADVEKLGDTADNRSVKAFARLVNSAKDPNGEAYIRGETKTADQVEVIAEQYLKNIADGSSVVLPEVTSESIRGAFTRLTQTDQGTDIPLADIYGQGSQIQEDLIRSRDAGTLDREIELQATEVNKIRKNSLDRLLNYFDGNNNYTDSEKAVMVRMASAWNVEIAQDGKVRVSKLTASNRTAMMDIGGDRSAYVVENLRKGMKPKEAFVEGVKKQIKDAKEFNKNKNRQGWVVHKKSSDQKDADNLAKACMGGNAWCTKGESTAHGQLSEGDFWIYYDNGEPEIALRLIDNQLTEVAGSAGGTAQQFAKPEYAEIAKDKVIKEKIDGENFLADMEFKKIGRKILDGKADIKEIMPYTDASIGGDGKVTLTAPYEMRHVIGHGDRNHPEEFVAELDEKLNAVSISAADIVEVNQIFAKGNVDLPNLAKVNYAILNTPNLTSIGMVDVIGTEFNAPKLVKAGRVEITGDNAAFNAPNAKEIEHLLVSLGASVTLSDKVKTIGRINANRASITVPSKAKIGEIYAARNSTVNIPNVVEVKSVTATSNSAIKFNSLTQADAVTADLKSTIDAPNLITAGKINIGVQSILTVDSLVTAGDVSIQNTTLIANNLKEAGSVEITAFSTLNAPSLIKAANFRIRSSTANSDLKEITGTLEVSGDSHANLPQLVKAANILVERNSFLVADSLKDIGTHDFAGLNVDKDSTVTLPSITNIPRVSISRGSTVTAHNLITAGEIYLHTGSVLDAENLTEHTSRPGVDPSSTLNAPKLDQPKAKISAAKFTPLPINEIKAVTDRAQQRTNAKNERSPKYVTVQSVDALPKSVIVQLKKSGLYEEGDKVDLQAVASRNHVYLIADNIRSIRVAEEAILHEELHIGAKGYYGEQLNGKLNKLYKTLGGSKGIRKYAKKNGINLEAYEKSFSQDGEYIYTKDVRNEILVEELIAYISQHEKDEKGALKKVVDEIRVILLEMAKDLGLTNIAALIEGSDLAISEIIKNARSNVRTGKQSAFVASQNVKKGLAPTAMFMVAYHGTPHDVDQFSTEKIGTGEGHQAYGYGLYFTEKKEIAKHYQKALSDRVTLKLDGVVVSKTRDVFPSIPIGIGDIAFDALSRGGSVNSAIKVIEKRIIGLRQQAIKGIMTKVEAEAYISPLYTSALEALKSIKDSKFERITEGKGNLYQVELAPKEDEYLLWDKPLSEQSELVQKALKSVDDETIRGMLADPVEVDTEGGYYWRHNGETYDTKQEALEEATVENIVKGGAVRQKEIAKILHEVGIRGVKYLDGSSRGKGEGDYNYVIFSDEDVEITGRFSRADDIRLSRVSGEAGVNLSESDIPTDDLGLTEGDIPRRPQGQALSDNETDLVLKKRSTLGAFVDRVLLSEKLRNTFYRRIEGIRFSVDDAKRKGANALGEIEHVFGKYTDITEATKEEMQKHLKGENSELNANQRTVIGSMRADVDRKSRRLLRVLGEARAIAEGFGTEAVIKKIDSMIETITANLDGYLNRSYHAYTNPKQWETYLTSGGGRKAAIESAMQEEGWDRDKAGAEIGAMVIAVETNSEDQLISSAPFTAIFKKRKDLPNWVGILLQEDNDPLNTFYKTLEKQEKLGTQLLFQNKFTQQLIEMGLVSKDQVAVGWKKPAAHAINSYSPLSDLFIHPSAFSSLNDYISKDKPSGFTQKVNTINMFMKKTSTIYHVASFATQVSGMIPFFAANTSSVSQIPKLMRDQMRFRNESKSGVLSEDHEFLLKRGLKQSYQIAEMEALMDVGAKWNEQDFMTMMTSDALSIDRAKMGLSNIDQKLMTLYGKPDEMLKLLEYYTSLDVHMKDGMSYLEARELAANEATDVNPHRSKMQPLLQQVLAPATPGALFAATLINPFLGFTVMAGMGMFRLGLRAKADLASGKKHRMMRGAKNLIGLSAVVTWAAMEAVDPDDDDFDLLGTIGLQNYWNKGKEAVFGGIYNDGAIAMNVRHFTNPYSIFTNPFRILFSDTDEISATEKIALAAKSFSSDFVGGSFILNAYKLFQTAADDQKSMDDLIDEVEGFQKGLIAGTARWAYKLYELEGETDTPEVRRKIREHWKKLARWDDVILEPADIAKNSGRWLNGETKKARDEVRNTVLKNDIRMQESDLLKTFIESQGIRLDAMKRIAGQLAYYKVFAINSGAAYDEAKMLRGHATNGGMGMTALKALIDATINGTVDQITIKTKLGDTKVLDDLKNLKSLKKYKDSSGAVRKMYDKRLATMTALYNLHFK